MDHLKIYDGLLAVGVKDLLGVKQEETLIEVWFNGDRGYESPNQFKDWLRERNVGFTRTGYRFLVNRFELMEVIPEPEETPWEKARHEDLEARLALDDKLAAFIGSLTQQQQEQFEEIRRYLNVPFA